MAADADRTLYQDWQIRRDRLVGQTPPPGKSWIAEQLRIFEYLLKRHKDDPEACRPARFPARSDLFLNRRAMVVHQHLGAGKVIGVRSEQDSRQRLSDVLGRMAEIRSEDDTKTPAGGAWLGKNDRVFSRDARLENAHAAKQKLIFATGGPWWWSVSAAFRPKKSLLDRIALALAVDPLVPEAAVKALYEEMSASGSVRACDLLTRCANASAIEYAVLTWKERLIACPPEDEIVQRLTTFMVQPVRRAAAAELLRAELAGNEGLVRKHALRLLAQVGSLDDIGLLTDLLALPESEIGDSERELLLETARTLAGNVAQPPPAERTGEAPVPQIAGPTDPLLVSPLLRGRNEGGGV